jgi:SAM-dependent methyltransferase
MGIKSALIDLSDSNPFLASLKYLKGQLLFRTGLRSHGSGATLARGDLEHNISYIEKVVREYFEYGKMSDGDLAGKNILEIGPGDTLGVAMLLLAKGAASVTCMDRFKPKIDPEKNRFVCEGLIRNLTSQERSRIDGLLDFFIRNESSPDGRLTVKYGMPIEKMADSGNDKGFDLIVSRAVLEHVYDLPVAWREMVRGLNTEGRMLHKVDFKSHKFFNKIHPLYFLTMNDWFWGVISSPDPTLNRKRSDTYRMLLSETFHQYLIYLTSVLENQELSPHPIELKIGEHYRMEDLNAVEAVRPLLAKPFREISDVDLLVSGIFIDCRRPFECLTY